MAHFSGEGIDVEGEEPVEGDEGYIDGVLLQVGIETRKLLCHQAPHYCLGGGEGNRLYYYVG